MDDGSLTIVLETTNKRKLDKAIPKTLSEVDVVTIFKKGKVEDPSNYRPIALLQSLYKLHAALLRNRLAEALDNRLDQNQYEFRSKKSTTQPLFVARRLIDIAEASGGKLFLTFLDWEKAFDTIDEEELINAVRTMNVPEETIQELKAIYNDIRFRITDDEVYSSERKQNTGIRQGCPLSPYLFIVLMTTMFHDIHTEVGEQIWTTAAQDIGTTELLYADDTLLISSNAKATNQLLKTIIKHSERYGMRLNKGKCEYFAINCKPKTKKDIIEFPEGDELKLTSSATYLDGNLQANGASKPEVEGRLSKAAVVFN
jgi:hypothetical protein